MKKVALILVLGIGTSGFAATKIGSVPTEDITQISETKTADKIEYLAEYKTEDSRGISEGAITCWKEKSGRIGCTESGMVFTRTGANSYQRQISDHNYKDLAQLYQKHEKE